jgi:putative addiction module component (TIGR02574 family)
MHKWGVAACGRARHTLAMSEPAFDFTELSVPERIQLVEDLWDSVAADTPPLTLSPEEVAELERRLAEMDANPEAGIPWEQVKADIERHLHQRG